MKPTHRFNAPTLGRERLWLIAAITALPLLATVSLFVGVSNVSLGALLSDDTSARATQVLMISRVPRTLALMLAGAGMSVCGTIMQMLARNRFVEPSTAGTVESASLGILAVMLLAPDLPVFVRMLVASLFALAGTTVFLLILRRIPLRSVLMVPIVGIILGGVIGAITTFFAYRHDMMQSLNAWSMGDFSGVLRGRYELLWISFALVAIAYIAAGRFTIAGMGEAFATNVGVNFRRIMALGLAIVSMVTATVVVTVGMIPFLGLVVPNIVSMAIGDNLRHSLPWVAVVGTGLVLLCDIAGRLVLYPYEMPIGAMMGMVGSAMFLYLLLRKNARVG